MATIARRRELRVLPQVKCPAGSPIAGVTPERGGVVCGVILNDRQREAGFDMDPAQLQIARGEGENASDVFLTLKEDPSTVEHLCCGAALPVLDRREVPGNRASYTYCPVWQAEKIRLAEDRRGLSDEPREEPVSHYDDGGRPAVGQSRDAADPWKQARRDLDVLAPQEA
jgi:hypothetical protein